MRIQWTLPQAYTGSRINIEDLREVLKKIKKCRIFWVDPHHLVAKCGNLFLKLATKWSKMRTSTILFLFNPSLSSTWDKHYIFSFTQFQFTEKDPVICLRHFHSEIIILFKAKLCRNYPTEEFESYGSCDRAFLQDECSKLGVMPFWATDDMKKVTFATEKLEEHGKLISLCDGTTESNCPRPCEFSLDVVANYLCFHNN